jgi:hypothetical protein
MLELKVRTVCCLHSGHVLVFVSVQGLSLSIATVMSELMYKVASVRVTPITAV